MYRRKSVATRVNETDWNGVTGVWKPNYFDIDFEWRTLETAKLNRTIKRETQITWERQIKLAKSTWQEKRWNQKSNKKFGAGQARKLGNWNWIKRVAKTEKQLSL